MEWKSYNISPFDSKTFADTRVTTDGRIWVTKFKGRSGIRLQAGYLADPDAVQLDIGTIETQKEFTSLRDNIVKIIEYNGPEKPFERIPPRTKSPTGVSYKKDKIFINIIEALVRSVDQREDIVPSKKAQPTNGIPLVPEPVPSPPDIVQFQPQPEQQGEDASSSLAEVEQQDLEMSADDFLTLMSRFNFTAPVKTKSGGYGHLDYDLRLTITRPRLIRNPLSYRLNIGNYFRANHLNYKTLLVGAGPIKEGKQTIVLLFDNKLLATDQSNFLLQQRTIKGKKEMALDINNANLCKKILLEAGVLSQSGRVGTNTHYLFDVKAMVIKDAQEEKDKNFFLVNMRKEVVEIREDEKEEEELA